MRYFRYSHTDQSMENALKAQYRSLTEEEKAIFRRKKRWENAAFAATCLLFSLCLVPGILALKAVPQPEGWLMSLALWLGKAAAGLFWVIVSGVISAGLTAPIWKKAVSFHLPAMKREILSKACAHLRQYYGLAQPCLITKCYGASHYGFQRHDVCLFVAGDELRMTTDLVRGFLHPHRDLGCCCFTREELEVSKAVYAGRPAVQLKAGDIVFLLGIRARRFIETHFIQPR